MAQQNKMFSGDYDSQSDGWPPPASVASSGYRAEDAVLVREASEAACRAKMLLRGTGNRGMEDHYAVLQSRLEALAQRIEQGAR